MKSARMSARMIDVNKRLVWSRSKFHRKRLVVFVIGMLGAIATVFFAEKELLRLAFGAAALVFFCMCLYDIVRIFEPGSALIELLPQGIIFRTTTEHFIVPWTEIKGVDTIDIATEFRGREDTIHGVTVILVSRLFYDRVVHIDSYLMRGPGWDAHFVEKDANTVQLALHHDILPASAEEIRRQVEERWKAFGNKPRMAPAIP